MATTQESIFTITKKYIGLSPRQKTENKIIVMGREPKSVKSFLNMLLAVAHTNRDDLKGIGRLSEKEYLKLGDMRAGVQNELSENKELLDKYNLKYNPDL